MKRRKLYVLLAVAVLLVLAVTLFAGFRGSGKKDIPLVTKVSFSLNGKDYATAPVLQDFIDHGWKRGKTVEEIGIYTEEKGVMSPVPTGYRLTSGSSRVNAYLDVDSCREGLQPGACRVRSLSLYGYNVESFCLGGKELAKTNSMQISDLLGEPNGIDENANGKIYHYSFPDDGISEITFAFPNTLDTVAQIFLILM